MGIRDFGTAAALAAALLAAAPAGAAEQVGFSARDTGAGRDYAYQLRDERSGAVAPVRFTLSREAVRDTSQGFKTFSSVATGSLSAIQAQGNRRCAEIAARYQGLATCSVTLSGDSFQIAQKYRKGMDHSGFDRDVKALMGELTRMRKQALETDGYRIEQQGDTMVWKPDYAALAKKAVQPLVPAAQAVKRLALPTAAASAGTKRADLAHAMMFVQAIPYERLGKQRATGMGYLTPLAVIDENRGDCDSKAVTYAALARTLAPGTPVAIILVPGHALVGLGIPEIAGDVTLRSGGITYVLAEPVGPAPAPIGQVGPLSESGLRGKPEVIRVF